MDTLSHGFAGSMLNRAATPRPKAHAAMLLGVAAAMLPDIDFLWAGDRVGYLSLHRGWTHSWIFLPFVSFGLALLARMLWRHVSLSELWLYCAIGQASHILFDWITSYGTMFFIPFTRHRYSLDWVFIIDPFFTAIPAAALLAGFFLRSRARLAAIVGAAALAAYIGLCAAMHARALTIWRSLDRVPPGARMAVVPQFLSPFRWLGLSEHETQVHAAFFDVGPFAKGIADPKPPRRLIDVPRVLPDFYPPPERVRIQKFDKAGESDVCVAARSLEEVRVFKAFARFPLETVTRHADGTSEYSIQDLRFLPFFAGPFGRGSFGGVVPQPFVFLVRFDASGRPVTRGFVPVTF
jgi:inner membrane protein